ncbi:MAG: hypothetical protein AWU57_694 [Marinobacter sp. T13-3]|nr:MAG: hypothetical protein AWU57_694 [Marinobacter sp. T13-3]
MLLGVSLAFVLLMKPFFGPIFWAVAMAVIFHPVERLLERRLGDRPNLNALITLAIGIVIVVIPVLGLGAALIAEGMGVYQQIQEGEIRPGEYIDQINESFPAIQAFLAQFDVNFGELRDRAVSAFLGGTGTGYWPEYLPVLSGPGVDGVSDIFPDPRWPETD